MAYALIIGSKATAQSQADFEAAVENVGGAANCVGGVAVDGNTVVQAVNANAAAAQRRKKAVRRRRKP